MSSSWRKVEDENGFSYYVNELMNVRQWDHPKFSDIKQRLDECNWIKYSTYRVASKFRVLQQALYMEEVSLSIIAGVFERHRLGSNESSLFLESYDVEAVMSDIYFAANKQNHTSTDIDLATELMINLLYNIYDKNRKGNIQVLSTKLALAVLSHTNLSDLYHLIFHLCADHNNCITRLKVQSILSKLADITTYLHEGASFGHHLVYGAVEHCFSKSPGLVGINESMFVDWFESTPELLAWLPVLCRLKTAETVVHASKCSVCKSTPLRGFKYRCIKCSRYIQCQRCYLGGRTSHSHKITHSMREHWSEASSREVTHVLVKKLCSLIKCSVPNNDSHIIDAKPLSTEKDCLLKSSHPESLICDIEPMSSPEIQLQAVIKQLEQQNKQIQHVIQLAKQDDKELFKFLEQHCNNITAEIQRLKVLKTCLKTSVAAVPFHKLSLESTPMVPNYRIRRKGIDMLSPIMQSELSDQDDVCADFTVSRTKNLHNAYDTTITPSLNDISTWIGGKPCGSTNNTRLNDPQNDRAQVREMHNDLDEALAKLQQILANNLMLDESLSNLDNGQLKSAVTEVEGMLTSLIENVECSRASSVELKALKNL